MRIVVESTGKPGDFKIEVFGTPHDKTAPGPAHVISTLLLVANSLVVQHAPEPSAIEIAGAGVLEQLPKS
jgi:hypothetical protein